MSHFTITLSEGYVLRLGADADLGHLIIEFPHGEGAADFRYDATTLKSTCGTTGLNHDKPGLSIRKTLPLVPAEVRVTETVSSKTPGGSSIQFAASFGDGTRPMDP